MTLRRIWLVDTPDANFDGIDRGSTGQPYVPISGAGVLEGFGRTAEEIIQEKMLKCDVKIAKGELKAERWRERKKKYIALLHELSTKTD